MYPCTKQCRNFRASVMTIIAASDVCCIVISNYSLYSRGVASVVADRGRAISLPL